MIQLVSLSLRNFMTLETLDMSFSPRESLMITGNNGSGKSTLFTAIALALIDYRKGDSYKDYVRRGCTEATLLLEARYKGHPITYDIKIVDAKYGNPMTKKITYLGTTYTNSECKVFAELHDMDYLEHTMFLFQNDSSIVDLKPAQRAHLLRKLFHFEFDDALASLKGSLDQYQLQKLSATARWEELLKRRFIPNRLVPELSRGEEASILKKLKSLQLEINKISQYDPEVVKRVEGDIAITKQARLAAEKSMKDNTSWLEVIHTNLDHKSVLVKNYQETINSIPEDIHQQVQDINKKIQEATSQMTDAASDVKLCNQEVNTLKSQLDISSAGICHACGHTIEEGHICELTEKYEKALKGKELAVEALSSYRKFVDELRSKETELRRLATSRESSLSNKRSAEKEIDSLNADKSRAESLIEEKKTSLTYLNTRLEALLVEDESHREVREQLAKQASLTKDKESLEEVLALQQKNKIVNEERQNLNKKMKEEKENHDRVVRELSQQVNDLSSQYDITKKAISILETDFPNFIILKTCAQLELYINSFIQKVFPYMEVKLKPVRSGVEFYYTSASSDNEWLSVKMASGAESAVLSLAWRVAIAKMYGVTTLLLDEVDAAASEENSQVIYEFIASLDTFKQIIFISHKKEAMRAIVSLMDSVTCYYVQDGEYMWIDEPI